MPSEATPEEQQKKGKKGVISGCVIFSFTHRLSLRKKMSCGLVKATAAPATSTSSNDNEQEEEKKKKGNDNTNLHLCINDTQFFS